MAGMLTPQQYAQLVAKQALSPAQAPAGLSPWEQMAFQTGAMGGGLLGAIPGLNAAKQQADEQKMAMGAIMQTEDPTARYQAAAEYMIGQGDEERADKYMKMAQRQQEFEQGRKEFRETMDYKKDQLSLEKEAKKQYNRYLGAQIDKWKAEAELGGKISTSDRSLLWAEQNKNSNDPAIAATAQKIISKREVASTKKLNKQFFTIVSNKLAPQKVGNQTLVKDMDPDIYNEFVTDVGLMAAKAMEDNPRLSEKKAIEDAWNMMKPMLTEQSWWQLGPDLEYKRQQAEAEKTGGYTPQQEANIKAVMDANPNATRDEVIAAMKQGGKL